MLVMVGRGSGRSFALATILSTAGAASATRTVFWIYLLRWSAMINFSTINFRLQHWLVSCPVVPMVVTPQRLVVLWAIRLNGCGPFKVEMISNERKKLVIRDVQRGKLRRFPLSL